MSGTSSSIEYTVMTRSKKGGTEAVIQVAGSVTEAREKILGLGYHEVVWILPDTDQFDQRVQQASRAT
jgi:hypothetical protein